MATAPGAACAAAARAACGSTALVLLAVWVAVVVAAPTAAAQPPSGRQKAAACASCHGENGISVQPNAPNLAGQPEPYLAEQLRHYRSGRRAHEVMSVIAKPLSDRDIDDLAAWYASIRVEATLPP